MEVSQISNSRAPQAEAGGDSINADFETFLRMLTTQIQNQDPLNPLKAEEFASQLATFSMVEQQTQTNGTLRKIDAALTGSRIFDHANLVGRTVLHENAFQFTGAPVEFELYDHDLTGGGRIAILNSMGQIVSTIPFETGQEKVSWEGNTTDGGFVQVGNYSAEIQNLEGNPTGGRPFTSSVVEEVTLLGETPLLLLADGTQVPPSAVKILR